MPWLTNNITAASSLPPSFWLVLILAVMLAVAQLVIIKLLGDRAKLRRELNQARLEADGWQMLHDRAQLGWIRANELNRQQLPEPERFGFGLWHDLRRVAEDEEAN